MIRHKTNEVYTFSERIPYQEKIMSKLQALAGYDIYVGKDKGKGVRQVIAFLDKFDIKNKDVVYYTETGNVIIGVKEKEVNND